MPAKPLAVSPLSIVPSTLSPSHFQAFGTVGSASASMAPVATAPSSASNSEPAELISVNRWHPKEREIPPRTAFAFDPLEDALAAFTRGEFLVVMDDESRENEGDLIVAASRCSTEQMAWMIKHTSGYICISLPGERLEELRIPMMVPQNEDRHRTAYTVTVDYKHGTHAIPSVTCPSTHS
ncbi:hypothetical protein EW146_g9938 [Bondarzewia mesenterica]|uniref:3,4-dihydroxy-2-butanone-4-phosphate synthase n=1 Tax=Bondarzewia mesenterica TaxID=1095465 RepID=A0A4S4L1Y1_9AGAM|nr:hypothetical protein EW146_g9938 [Bondarzewia mesenterica]